MGGAVREQLRRELCPRARQQLCLWKLSTLWGSLFPGALEGNQGSMGLSEPQSIRRTNWFFPSYLSSPSVPRNPCSSLETHLKTHLQETLVSPCGLLLTPVLPCHLALTLVLRRFCGLGYKVCY